MDDLQTVLDGLDDLAESYVLEKARNPNDAVVAILSRVGVSKSKFYEAYDSAARQHLDEIAARIYRDSQFRALRTADEKAVEAMQVLVRLMVNAKSEYVRLQAAQGLLAYAIGTPTQRIDITTRGQSLKLYEGVSPDDWDETD